MRIESWLIRGCRSGARIRRSTLNGNFRKLRREEQEARNS
jgi:hypothetical protein